MQGNDRLWRRVLAVLLLPACSTTWAQTPGGSTGSGGAVTVGGSEGGDPTRIPAAVSSGWGWTWYLPYPTIQSTPNGTITTIHPPLMGGVPVWLPPTAQARTTTPAPPPGLIRSVATPRPAMQATKADLEKAAQNLTLGDRLFRAGDLKRAEERYERAGRLNPFSAAPRLRLMQVAVVRGHYATASSFLREAETAEPGWIPRALDVKTLYAEPESFASEMARLEEHLQKSPEDHDAWLVLGAQLFLARREALAADVFRRLDDPRRKPDVALAAFLDASRLTRPAPRVEGPPPRVADPTPNPFFPPAP